MLGPPTTLRIEWDLGENGNDPETSQGKVIYGEGITSDRKWRGSFELGT